jgi:hypothetical protein
MRYRLRTLLIVLALGPPLIWAAWSLWPTAEPDPQLQIIVVEEEEPPLETIGTTVIPPTFAFPPAETAPPNRP